MGKVLDERFIVVNKKDKNEYIEKINEFINQHKGFRPTVMGTAQNSAYRWVYNNLVTLLQRGNETKGFIPLDGKFFYRGNINTNSYFYHICHNPSEKKNVVVLQPYWGGYISVLTTDNPTCTLSMVQRLYKKLVTEVIDQAILLREHKIFVDVIGSSSSIKYHYNTNQHIGYNIIKAVCNREQSFVEVTYSTIKPSVGTGFQLIAKKPYRYTYTFAQFKQKFIDNSIVSNDFNVIQDEIAKDMEKRLSEMVAHNNTTIETFKNY